MKLKALIIAAISVVAISSAAEARTSCTSYNSGSYRKTSCSHSSHGRSWFSHGTSYKSGSYRKSYWR